MAASTDDRTASAASKMSSHSVENPTIRSVKADDISSMLPVSQVRNSSAKGSLTPGLTDRESSFAMDFDEYKPSLADQVRVGYFSQDRASQTEASDIIELQQMTNVMRQLIVDLDTTKRNIHYAKYILKAEYENQLQERSLDLYCRVNERLLELEKDHQKRVQVMRRCFRQQLGDAITEVAKKHKAHYTNKRKEESARMAEKLGKAKDEDDENKKAKQQQESMLDMMRMQMKEAQERADAELREALERRASPSSIATDPEIYELRDEVENLEKRLDDALTEIEDKENENKRLVGDVDMLNEQLHEEKEQVHKLKKEMAQALLNAEQERNRLRSEMERQRVALQNEMENRIHDTKKSLLAESQKQVEKLKMLHEQKSKEQDLLQQQKLQELSKVERPTVNYKTYKPAAKSVLPKEEISESEKDEIVKHLQKIEKKQRMEISRLQKELDRANKTWEMKVTILQQTMHAIRDESFLRTSLQKKAAKLQHAAVVYASTGPAVIPLSTPHRPSKTFRTLPSIRPGRVEGFGRILEGKRIERERETPFTEDRFSPPLENLDDEEQRNQQSTENQQSESISIPDSGCIPTNRDQTTQIAQVAMPTSA